MTKYEVIEALADRQKHLAFNDVELAVKNLLEQMSQAPVSYTHLDVYKRQPLHLRPFCARSKRATPAMRRVPSPP